MKNKSNNSGNNNNAESINQLSSKEFFEIFGNIKINDLNCTVDEFKDQLFAEIERKMNQPAGFKK